MDDALCSACHSHRHRFAVWRRSILWVSVLPTAFAALFGLINVIDMDKDEKQALSNFGIFLQYLPAILR